MTGHVTDVATGAPVRGAHVDVPQLGVATLTDAAGAYTVTSLPAGRWVLRVRAPGYTTGLGVAPSNIRLRALAPIDACPAGPGIQTTAPVLTLPSSPIPGSLIQFIIPADSAVALRAMLFGQPITFSREYLPTNISDSAGDRTEARPTFVGIGAVPLDSTHDGAVKLMFVYPTGSTAHASGVLAVTKPVVLTAGPPRREALHVAPQFAARPSGSTAQRVAAENELAHEVGEQSLAMPPLWNEPFVHPRPGRVTSPFGGGRQFNGKLIARHTGTDFAGQVGDSVGAANRGVVAMVGDFFLAGTVVYIDHGGGLTSAYFHLSQVNVAVGDTVRRGQRIGSVGATGRVTGPHLHWVVRYGTTSVDPLGALTLQVPTGTPVPPCK
jgi:murein DD-endopeptidase MepM/ murein hydrolase activator NlpD